MKQKDMLNSIIIRGATMFDSIKNNEAMKVEIKELVISAIASMLEPTFEYLKKTKDEKLLQIIIDPAKAVEALKAIIDNSEKRGIIIRKTTEEIENETEKDDTKKDDNPA